LRPGLKHNDTGGVFGRETPYLAEIAIQPDEDALLLRANLE
jgi:hypothetical protein